MNQPKLVLLGGGTGSFTLLQALKLWTPNITAIVNMSDSGGSTGILRDELGVLPPGDIRQCLVALSNHPETRDLFSYRFNKGKLSSHTVGNLMLSALELQTGSIIQAIRIASEFLKITGKVVPVTIEKNTLVLEDGKQTIRGEQKISEHLIVGHEAKVRLEPNAKVNPTASRAIKDAEMIIIAPGDIYTSLLPVLKVSGMPEALSSSKAKIVMVANLINKPLHSLDWHVMDYVREIEAYIGIGAIDYVLYNTQPPSKELLDKYAGEGEFPLKNDPARFSETKAHFIGAPLVASQPYRQDQADKLTKRSLIRHDPLAVKQQLEKILFSFNQTTWRIASRAKAVSCQSETSKLSIPIAFTG